MSVTVYVALDSHPGARPGPVQPAFRAWADALIARAGASSPMKSELASIRPTAQIGRIEPIGYYKTAIEVDATLCLAATSSDLLRVYFPPAWSEDLLEYLGDRGYSPDLVRELVLPCDAPMVPVEVEKMAAVIAETPSDLVRSIHGFFSEDIDQWLGSVRSLEADRGRTSEDSEILVSSSAG